VEERDQIDEKGLAKLSMSIAVPAQMTSALDLDALNRQINEIKVQLGLYAGIEVSFTLNRDKRQ